MERVMKGIKWLFRKGESEEFIRKAEVFRIIDDFDVDLYADGSVIGDELRKKLLKGAISRLRTRSIIEYKSMPSTKEGRSLLSMWEGLL